jgi:hypothetical protein
MTARVNAMRQNWWTAFDLPERVRRLPDAAQLPEYAALHRVGHKYEGRRSDALELPTWAKRAATLDALVRLYQRPLAAFERLNAGEAWKPQQRLSAGTAVSVPDPGFVPHLAARLAAEALGPGGAGFTPASRLALLRSLVPAAVISPTALDAILTRLVLAWARDSGSLDLPAVAALDAVLSLRVTPTPPPAQGELIYGHLPA